MKGEAEYETKTFKYRSDDGVSAYRIMATRVENVSNSVLGETGFGSVHMVYANLEGRPMYTTYDGRRFGRKYNDDGMVDFLLAIDSSSMSPEDATITWEDIEDGGVYTKEDI